MAFFEKKQEMPPGEMVKAIWQPEPAAPQGEEENSAKRPDGLHRQAGVTSPESSHSYLDQTCKVSGKLIFDRPAWIDGRIEGEISAKESLTIAEGAVVTAEIKAASIIVAGTVSGDIVARERIVIRQSGKLSGKVITPRLVVHEGAVFDGRCAMQPVGAHNGQKVIEPWEEISEARVTRRGADRQAFNHRVRLWFLERLTRMNQSRLRSSHS